MSNICVIAAHPDDETLGCGGTLLKHRANGDPISWVIMTAIDEKNGWEKAKVEERRQEIQEVKQQYGFDKTFALDFPTTKLDTIPMSILIQKMAGIIQEIKPEIIYLPNRSDIHTDHQITFQAAYSCTKNFRYPFIKRVLMYETLSETEFSPAVASDAFVPNVFIDITDNFARKIEIMKIYGSEVMPEPFPRSLRTLEALALFRGSMAGVRYAESFMLLKEIIQ